MYRKYIKRILDFILSLLVIIILSPVLLIVAVLVRIKLGSPVIFKQKRPGLNGKIFTMYKFRTMKDALDWNGNKLTDVKRLEMISLYGNDSVTSDEERLTKFGNLLRKLSIDELPELFNILKGDMSFVGPRPLAVIYLPYYTEEEFRRHSVKPGLTGYAQVNGRNMISWEDKFQFDLLYVDKISFVLDVRILIKTIYVTLKHDDIGQGSEKPVPFHILRQKGENKE